MLTLIDNRFGWTADKERIPNTTGGADRFVQTIAVTRCSGSYYQKTPVPLLPWQRNWIKPGEVTFFDPQEESFLKALVQYGASLSDAIDILAVYRWGVPVNRRMTLEIDLTKVCTLRQDWVLPCFGTLIIPSGKFRALAVNFTDEQKRDVCRYVMLEPMDLIDPETQIVTTLQPPDIIELPARAFVPDEDGDFWRN
jgi:hypothetical protein